MANLEGMPISALPELTGDLQDEDEIVVYRPSTGKAYQANTDLIDSLYSIPQYTNLADIGLNGATVTGLAQIAQAMPNPSRIVFSASNTTRDNLYATGVIPYNANGIVEIVCIGRCRALYNDDSNRFYINATNAQTADWKTWVQIC